MRATVAAMAPPRPVWYVAYGSNTASTGLARYLRRVPAAPSTRWVDVPHALHFAGYSHRWDGGVAFLDRGPAPPGAHSRGRAYPLSVDDLGRVAAAENGQVPIGWPPDLAGIPVGGWTALTLPPRGGDDRLGKYDALLRLPDIDHRPAFTLTAARALPPRPPGAAYLAACRAGLIDDPGQSDVDGYLAAAGRRSVSSW